MEPIYWLLIFIVLLVIEIVTLGLATIWFAGGAIIGFIAALLGLSLELQIVLFLVVSVLLLVFTRPFAVKYINRNTTKTNVESVVGKVARVTERISNELETGTAVLNGQEWTARSVRDQEIPAGSNVVVTSVKGVKLIVDIMKEEL